VAVSDSVGESRHSILDLAPLELDCMNALWPSGEATVRQIQETLRPTRPRAYTTIMTILDRLARKGIVQRRKSGRAWVYRASVSAEQARTHAVEQVVEGFFGGSAGALASHLSVQRPDDRGGPGVRLTVPVRDNSQVAASLQAKGRSRRDAEEAAAKSSKATEPPLETALL
jgi:BlaI family transcriptional regulator, penicillinase repressor